VFCGVHKVNKPNQRIPRNSFSTLREVFQKFAGNQDIMVSASSVRSTSDKEEKKMQYCVHANMSAVLCSGSACLRRRCGTDFYPRFERSRLLLPRAARREEGKLASDH